MASLIHELENNETLLMMFLSGELPADDHLEVEQMLAGDAGLRAELAEVESAYTGAMGLLAKLDADRSAVPAENHAVRQAMRAMKQWQVDQLARQPVLIAPPRQQIPIWVYSLASVAALLIGTVAWWGFGGQFHTPIPSNQDSQSGVPGTGFVAIAPPAPSVYDAIADRLDDSLNTDAGPIDAPSGVAPAGDASAGNTSAGGGLAGDAPSSAPASISDAETQASALVARSDNASVASEILPIEANP